MIHELFCLSENESSSLGQDISPKKDTTDSTVQKFLKGKGFNPTIVNKIMNSSPRKKSYSNSDICEAILIRSISTKAYQTIRANNLTVKPLPHLSTLQRKIKKFQCPPGFQLELFHLIKLKLSEEDFAGRQSVIMFDEISLKEKVEYCPRLKKMFSHHDKAQVVMLR